MSSPFACICLKDFAPTFSELISVSGYLLFSELVLNVSLMLYCSKRAFDNLMFFEFPILITGIFHKNYFSDYKVITFCEKSKLFLQLAKKCALCRCYLLDQQTTIPNICFCTLLLRWTFTRLFVNQHQQTARKTL